MLCVLKTTFNTMKWVLLDNPDSRYSNRVSLFGLLQQKYHRLCFKLQTFIFHGSGTGKSKIQMLADSLSRERPFPITDGLLLSVPSHGRKVEGAF